MIEICDIYDAEGNKTGEVYTRGETLKDGQYHLAANIWVINSKSQILIQKRSECKDYLPGIWATHGGCAHAGETSLNACIREAYEEIGIILQAENVKLLSRKISNNLIMDDYAVVQDFDISSAVLQSEEVSEIKWVSLDEIKPMVEKKIFFEYTEFPYVIDFISNHRC